MKCIDCGTVMMDVTKGHGDDRHYLCRKCLSHVWKGNRYLKSEWQAYMDSLLGISQKNKKKHKST